MFTERYHDCRITSYHYKGHAMIAMENAHLRVTIIADQGADLFEIRHKALDVDVLWHAPQELLPPGATVPPTYREQGNFLDYLHGGWQEVLPNGHLNCFYKGASLGQHGEVSVLPWSVRVVEDSPASIAVAFTVRTRRTPFRLERIVSMNKHEAAFRFDETVTNEGREDMDFMWGHHPAFGAPFLEEGCEIRLPEGAVAFIPEGNVGPHCRLAAKERAAWPDLPGSAGGTVRADRVPGPGEASSDSFCLAVPEGWYEVVNPRLGLAVHMTWDAEVFPYVWCWQVYGGAYGYPYYGRTYNLAVEPFTSPIATLAENAASGKAARLGAGESVHTSLSFGLHASVGR